MRADEEVKQKKVVQTLSRAHIYDNEPIPPYKRKKKEKSPIDQV